LESVAVVTLVTSPPWAALAETTLPSQRAYAERLGADFIVLNRPVSSHPHYDKWQIGDVLTQYGRMLYLDADVVIRRDCPDLFVMVPPQFVGGENELLSFPEHAQHLERFVERMGWPPMSCPYYLNGGVIVASSMHRPLFRPPEQVFTDLPWPEQNHMNARLIGERIPVCYLPSSFNDRHRTGDYLRESFILHYSMTPLAQRVEEARRDLAGWDELFQRRRLTDR
jgi:hypothetical protein